jgi:hypothetical protein
MEGRKKERERQKERRWLSFPLCCDLSEVDSIDPCAAIKYKNRHIVWDASNLRSIHSWKIFMQASHNANAIFFKFWFMHSLHGLYSWSWQLQ